MVTLAFAADPAERTITTITGTGNATDGGAGGPALETNLGSPFGVQVGPDGGLYICEYATHRIRRVDLKTGEITNIAGTGKAGYSGDGGPAKDAQLNQPHEIIFDSGHNMYITDMRNHAIRKIDGKTKIISTIAGTGEAGFSGDGGQATKAQLKQPHSVCNYDDGHRKLTPRLVIADVGNHRVRMLNLETGIIETIAGTGVGKLPTEGGTAKETPLHGPRAVWSGINHLWIALREGNSVWRLDMKHNMKNSLHSVAGTGKAGFAVEKGPAKDAQLNGPKGIVQDRDGSLLVVDSVNHVVRRIDPKAGTISLVAGQPGKKGFGGDGGPAGKSLLNNPHGIGIGPDGSIYIGDSDNHRVRKIAPK